jgi:hypothetical protein
MMMHDGAIHETAMANGSISATKAGQSLFVLCRRIKKSFPVKRHSLELCSA